MILNEIDFEISLRFIKLNRAERPKFQSRPYLNIQSDCSVQSDFIKFVTLGNDFSQIKYQACAVFAGARPATPHPTLFPTGGGSFSSSYEIPKGHTFFYMKVHGA